MTTVSSRHAEALVSARRRHAPDVLPGRRPARRDRGHRNPLRFHAPAHGRVLLDPEPRLGEDRPRTRRADHRCHVSPHRAHPGLRGDRAAGVRTGAPPPPPTGGPAPSIWRRRFAREALRPFTGVHLYSLTGTDEFVPNRVRVPQDEVTILSQDSWARGLAFTPDGRVLLAGHVERHGFSSTRRGRVPLALHRERRSVAGRRRGRGRSARPSAAGRWWVTRSWRWRASGGSRCARSSPRPGCSCRTCSRPGSLRSLQGANWSRCGTPGPLVVWHLRTAEPVAAGECRTGGGDRARVRAGRAHAGGRDRGEHRHFLEPAHGRVWTGAGLRRRPGDRARLRPGRADARGRRAAPAWWSWTPTRPVARPAYIFFSPGGSTMGGTGPGATTGGSGTGAGTTTPGRTGAVPGPIRPSFGNSTNTVVSLNSLRCFSDNAPVTSTTDPFSLSNSATLSASTAFPAPSVTFAPFRSNSRVTRAGLVDRHVPLLDHVLPVDVHGHRDLLGDRDKLRFEPLQFTLRDRRIDDLKRSRAARRRPGPGAPRRSRQEWRNEAWVSPRG